MIAQEERMNVRSRSAAWILAAVLVALPFVSGCESKQQREENTRLKGQVSSLTQEKTDLQKRVDQATQENTALKAKVDELTQKVTELEASKKAPAKPAAKAPAKAAPKSTKPTAK